MAGRRGKGEGSIFQRGNGTWTCTIDVGRNADGKRLRRTVTGKTKRSVTEKLTELQTEKSNGTLVVNNQTTVGEFLDWWLDDVAAQTVRAKTLAWYRQVVATHIKPTLGTIRLQKLAKAHIQSRMAEMTRDNASPRMKRIVFAVIHCALVQAVKHDAVKINVAAALERPKVPKHEIKPMNGDQVAAFLLAAESDRLSAMYVVALSTGMRQGEMFGLEWNDIDLKAGTLMVRRTLVEMDGEFSTNEPKTDKGRRLIELPQMAVESLWEHKARQLAEGLASSQLVFTDTDGKPLRRSNVTRRSFHPILKAAGLQDVRFHDLRHSSATLLLSAGIHPKIVQERLGHSEIGMTLNTYSHVLPGMQREAATKLDGMLRKKLG